MAQEYADEHRLIRYRGGQARDITAFAGNLQAVDELNALSVELSFDVITAPWDGYVEKNLVTPGDKLRLVNHDRTVFAAVHTNSNFSHGHLQFRLPAYTHI